MANPDRSTEGCQHGWLFDDEAPNDKIMIDRQRGDKLLKSDKSGKNFPAS